MSDVPVLFSSPMVRALWDGRKTQTRRIIKAQPPEDVVRHCWYSAPLYGFTKDHDVSSDWHVVRLAAQPGDRMWVRESGIRTKLAGREELPGLFRHDVPDTPARGFYWVESTRTTGAAYSVEGCSRKAALAGGSKACPSIHMPRWASRMTLIVTDVRVERLQDISEADAVAEGIQQDSDGWRDYLMPHTQCCSNPVDSYRTLWDHINGTGAWDPNPWVAAYTFRVVKQNIDKVAE